jgi:hypothetical protein
MNGGGDHTNGQPGTSPLYSSTNGNWDGTSIYTPTDGSTPASTVTVGDWANVFNDGTTTPVYIARVTAVAAGANGAITLSTTAKVGTAPTSSATARSINVGGAWKGPNGSVGFPLSFMTGIALNSNGDTPRINFKNDQTYNIQAAIAAPSANDPIYCQGYTTSFGDGGKATLSDNLAGASYTLFNTNLVNGSAIQDFIFDGNGATGSANGVTTARGGIFRNCIFRNMRGSGITAAFNTTNSLLTLIECEAYANNASNTAGRGGFDLQTPAFCLRSISHDNSGGNSRGFSMTNAVASLVDCIACNNGGVGIFGSSTPQITVINCDSYNNGSHGLEFSGQGQLYAENCNLVKNGGYGVQAFATVTRVAYFVNCAFGTGTQANTSGTFDTTFSSRAEIGTVTLASGVTPWNAPSSGDFTITLAAVKAAGRNNFLQTNNSPNPFAGTTAYRDIGAAQHQDTGGAAAGLPPEPIIIARGTPF